MVLASILTTSSTYCPFLVLDGHNLVFDFAVMSVVDDPSNPSFCAVFVEYTSRMCDGAAWGVFGGSGTGGTAAIFTFSAAVANKPLKSM